MYDRITNRINNINEVIDIIIQINNKLKEKNSYINSYINSPLIFLVDDLEMIYKLNAKIYETLNFIWYEIYRKNRKIIKNRISSNEVNTSKI